MKNESSVRNQSQVERAQRLRRQIERLKAGRIPEERPEHGKSLKEQIEERLGSKPNRPRSTKPSPTPYTG